MPCRRVSFSGSFPRTGRSKSASIRRGWRSGNRSRSPAESDSRHKRTLPASLGERVSRSVRSFSPVCGLLLILAASPSVSRGAVRSQPEPPKGSSEPAAAPAAAPPAPAPSPSPPAAPPQEASPPSQEAGQGPGAGQGAQPAAGQESPEETEGSKGPAAGSKGVIGRIVVDGNVRV